MSHVYSTSSILTTDVLSPQYDVGALSAIILTRQPQEPPQLDVYYIDPSTRQSYSRTAALKHLRHRTQTQHLTNPLNLQIHYHHERPSL